MRDFLGGSEVENLPSNAGDLGSIPAWRTKIPQASGQLSLGTTAREGLHVTRKSLHATMKTQCKKKRPSAAPPQKKKFQGT